jgi:hypothetical protein
MDTNPDIPETNLDDVLNLIGMTREELDALPPMDGDDLARASMEAMAAGQGTARTIASVGNLHFTGEAVKGHTMPAKRFARLIEHFQDLVTAVGAHLAGTPDGGKVPTNVKAATRLFVIASPSPGSVQVDLTPEVAGIDVAEPDGEPLIRDTEAARPLADRAAESALDLMVIPEDADLDPWANRVSEYGTRSARALRRLMGSVSQADLTVDASWHEPGHELSRVAVSSVDAGRAFSAIRNRQLESVETDLTGEMSGLGLDNQPLAIGRGSDAINIKRGRLDEETLKQLHLGDMVRVHVTENIELRPGGEERVTYEAIRLSKLKPE